ncbi:MopE-related protein [Thermodesulfobacteriota bacterium]
MDRKFHIKAMGVVFLVILLLFCNTVYAENIDPDNDDSQYAWGENVGWLNLEPDAEGDPGVQVGGDELTGYIWHKNIGWISLSCTNTNFCEEVDYKVINDGVGNLSGYAWSKNAGWISFSCENTGTCITASYGVFIDPATGVFSGYAWSKNVGWISFSCENTDTCGTVDFGVKTAWRDSDGDGYSPPDDCDDGNASINPGAVEACDNVDNNCDEQIDEGLPQYTYYVDSDGDDYGDTENPLVTCQGTPPAGYATNSTDCNDGNASINPGAAEACDNVDNDCDGQIDEGFDADGDGTADCNDGCPNDPNKTAPGDCDCGTPDTDTDGDSTADCNDNCSDDPDKTEPGTCGCGVADTDSDSDGTLDCNDGCPCDPNTNIAGRWCSGDQTDSDGDGTPDCGDNCPYDPEKTEPGDCGCGESDVDSDKNGTPDCNDPDSRPSKAMPWIPLLLLDE